MTKDFYYVPLCMEKSMITASMDRVIAGGGAVGVLFVFDSIKELRKSYPDTEFMSLKAVIHDNETSDKKL